MVIWKFRINLLKLIALWCQGRLCKNIYIVMWNALVWTDCYDQFYNYVCKSIIEYSSHCYLGKSCYALLRSILRIDGNRVSLTVLKQFYKWLPLSKVRNPIEFISVLYIVASWLYNYMPYNTKHDLWYYCYRVLTK